MSDRQKIIPIGDAYGDVNDVAVTQVITDPLLQQPIYDSMEATKLMEEFWKAYY